MQNNKEAFVILFQIPIFHVDVNVTEASVRVPGPPQHF